MTVTSLFVDPSATSESNIAVRVSSVSKIYRLWNSPRARLAYPLKRLLNSLLPPFLRKDEEPSEGFREFHALEDISFEIRKGESWGFIGVNGSGKSTLLKIISGNLRPSSGTVEVEGKTTILDYSSGLNGEFTGRENVYHKGTLLGLTKKQVDERFQSIEEFADIGEFIDQPVKVYSSGMTARLGFAIMSHVDADILITDEALAVGDAFFVQKCMRYIHEFLSEGTFLFVSHSTSDVMSLCSHAIWLEHGRVAGIGKASDVCRAYMNSIDQKKSEGFLEETFRVDPNNAQVAECVNIDTNVAPAVRQWEKFSTQTISVSAVELAELKNHFAPNSELRQPSPFRTSLLEVQKNFAEVDDLLEKDGAIGGGRIFSVTITNDKDINLPWILGGEIIFLTVRAVAERLIERPILGFQLKNNLGLTLVADNSFYTTRGQVVALRPGEVISARFLFTMPLVPVGVYVFRAGFADGFENNNALIDVKHEALLLRCETSGVRHGLVGVPMLSIDVIRETSPLVSSAPST